MKRRKILYLFPLAALVLSGCSFDDVKTWVSDKVFTPIVNLFTGKKNNNTDNKDGKDSGGNTPAPSTDSDAEEIVATEVGSVESPLSVTEFQKLCDDNIKYDDVAKGKSIVDYSHIAYIKAKVRSNTWNTEGTKIQYLNLYDPDNSTLEVTAMFANMDSSITKDYSAKDSLAGEEVIVRGYPALFHDNKDNKKYELESKDKTDTENPKVMKVVEPEGTPGVNYGSEDAPLTVTEAKALIDKENPTKIKAYVTGEVTSNEAWSAQYGNIMRIFISDGQSELVIFKCATFPADVDKENIAANKLKGKTVVVKGIGELFQETTYELTAPEILSMEGEDLPPVVIDDYGSLESPLSISEAKAVIDLQDPTEEDLYVTGEVKSNTAWSTKYNNIDIVLTDGENDFTLYRASTLPESAQPAENALVGKVIIAHGKGKTYNKTTYELDSGCTVDSITDAAPIVVESVVLNEQSLELEVGDNASLSASVLPAKASQEVEWAVSQTGEVISFEGGVVTALAEGSATVTATSVADPTKSASCTVTVSAATKTLTGIAIDDTNAKTSYSDGENYSEEGLVVTASYSDSSSKDVTEFVEWSFSSEVAHEGDDEVTITASYGGFTESVTVSVSVTLEKGTLQNPYSISEAYAIYQGLESGSDNGKSVCVEGYINSTPAPSIGSNRGNFYLTDGVCAVDAYAYGINNVGNSQDVTLADIPVGGRALVQCAIKNYGGIFELCFVSGVSNGCLAQAVEAPVLSSVGQPVGPAEVSVGGSIDPSQVTVPVVYSGIVSADIHPTSVTGDFSEAGTATAYVTVDGWESTLSFQVTVSSGTVLVETEVYKLDGTVTGGSSGYGEASEITQNNVVWSIEGNTTMNPWRIGGKNLSGVDRTAKSTQAVTSDDLTKVVVTTGTKTLSAVNSITIKVGSTEGASDLGSKEFTTNLVSASLEFARPNDQTWTNAFITVVFNVNAASSNQYIQLTAISLYAMK